MRKTDNKYKKKTSVTVTEAARNFADCVNRVHYQNVTFVLVKNGEPFARLVPDDEKVSAGRDLAEALSKAGLPETAARTWPRDLRTARRGLKAPPTRARYFSLLTSPFWPHAPPTTSGSRRLPFP